ncbi:MAG: O-antigen ligase family protein [Patescibacteria group bacterium]|jgi:O-antigen ligase
MQPEKLYDNYFKITFLILVILETLSFLGHSINLVNSLIFFLLIIGTLIVGLWRLEYGFWILTAELITGSFGYLFYYDMSNFRISIRLGLFLAVFVAWAVNAIREKKIVFKNSNLFWPLTIFVIFIAWGIVSGIIHHNILKNVFFDVNAYLFFGLIFIAYQVVNSYKKIIAFFKIMLASLTLISLKTFFLLFYFSHQTKEDLIRLVYTWVRDTRVGEIAGISGNYSRIFFQSHIWCVFALLIIIIFLILYKNDELKRKNRTFLFIMLFLNSTTLIISFSRSLWLALAVSFVLLLVYLIFKEKLGIKSLGKIALISLIIIIINLATITFLVNIKIPGSKANQISTGSLIKDRITQTEEAALVSRYDLLKPLASKVMENPVMGSGFGTTVSYKSSDPRTKNVNGGIYTSYAFEWGYLDIAIKIGMLGLIVYLYFIWRIFSNCLKLMKITKFRIVYLLVLGLIFSLIALLVTHATTPYLNHPLGIFLIVIAAAFSDFLIKQNLIDSEIESAPKSID